jgi:hypothetical protein
MTPCPQNLAFLAATARRGKQEYPTTLLVFDLAYGHEAERWGSM